MALVSALTIAGSDSGGGAGIQADLRTFSAFGVHGTTALTAVTAQNTKGVFGVQDLAPDFVEQQIRTVTEDFSIASVKTGMLATPSIVERVAALASEGLLPHLVVDPVLIATSGDALMDAGGVRAFRDALFPFAQIVTPNLVEAAALCGEDVRDVTSVDDLERLAKTLLTFGPRYVLVKGGHLPTAGTTHRSPDLLIGADGVVVFDAPRVTTANDHGTGCSLSAAICSGIAQGRSVADATRDAKSFVLAALRGAATWRLGSGRGPIDHLGWGDG